MLSRMLVAVSGLPTSTPTAAETVSHGRKKRRTRTPRRRQAAAIRAGSRRVRVRRSWFSSTASSRVASSTSSEMVDTKRSATCTLWCTRSADCT